MRVLVTGLGTFWGSRLAQRLEADPVVEMVVGLDTRAPRLPLERTEYVEAESSYANLHRILQATRADTIVHTNLEVDSTRTTSRRLHEQNVIATGNLFAAAGASGSAVRKIVVKASSLVYGSNYTDPYWFRDDSRRTQPATTPVERSLVEIAELARDFAVDHPDVTVSELRFANVLGSDLSTVFSRMLRMPVVPEVLGFDPRLQFVHEDDVTAALAFATHHDAPGTSNVAGPGTMTWSAVCAAVGRRRVPMPPLFTGASAVPLRLARIVDIPPEVLSLLRYGRAVDTARFVDAGFRYEYDTPQAVEAFARVARRERVVGRSPPYRYSPALEAFLRHSPAARR